VNQSDAVLISLLKSIRELKKVACVFDMDSTLFCVSPRTQAILRELAIQESFSSQFHEHAKLLKEITLKPHDWGTKDALIRLGLRFPENAIQLIREFWREKFFSNDYLKHDLMYDSSQSFVQLCKDLNCEIFYLTGRSERLMREGSVRQLENFKFPLAKPEHLIMKTDEFVEDEDFKLKKLREIKKDFDHVYFFENEPVITESIQKNLPEVNIIFMDSTHSSRREKPKDLPTITPESYKQIKDFE
jgi:hypothetical protein